MLVDEIAQYLHQQGLGVFAPDGIGGDIFVATLPQAPDECVMLRPTGGFAADSKLGYDDPTVQILVRGTQDPRTGGERAQAIYGALQGLHDVALPGGTWVVSCLGLQSGPVHIGSDGNGRHEYSLNFRFEIRSLSANRE